MLYRRLLTTVGLFLFFCLPLGVVYGLRQAAPATVTDLRINEFMALNETTLEDPDEPGDFPDWIEIYNGGETAVNLQGLYLTDDLSQPTRYQIPSNITIPAKGFALFYADSQPEQGATHTNFGLGGGGETVALIDSDGSTIIDSHDFGPQTADISEGRVPDGGSTWQPFTAPSPGSSNAIAPTIEDLVQTPLTPSSSDSVTINARITDDGTITFATLFYSATHTSFTALPMSALANNRYEATIPAFPANTAVDYYIEAGDNSGLSSRFPVGAPANSRRYIVGFTPPPLTVNEFMAFNTSLPDPDEPGDFPDWIELYNAGETAVNLQGYHLTDDLTNLTKSPINGPLFVPANGFLLVYADNSPQQGANHTSFALSSTNGEDIALVAPDGVTIIDSYTFGPQTADISEGRSPNGADNWVFFNPATPGASNVQVPIISNSSRSPEFPTAADPVTITTTVSDDGTVTVTLFYAINGGSPISLPMTSSGDNQYSATIPAQASGATVTYYISASDNDSNTAVDPPGAPANSYQYVIDFTPPALTINEFMASNTATVTDPAEPTEFPDWIELYNGEETAVNLQGYYLSDDPANLTKSPITQTLTIPAGGFLLIYADNDPFQGPDHASFALGSSGESILLVAPDGSTIVDSYTFGPQTADISEGRLPDGDPNWVFFNVPTPGSSNALFPPAISNTSFSPSQPNADDTVTVSSNISDDGTITNATLFYSSGGPFIAAPMTAQSNGQYQATIPAFPTNAEITFYVTAQDNDGLISSDPPTAPSDTYSYIVGFAPPPLQINEFMASNESVLPDPDDPTDFPDWIELYHGGQTAISLAGYYLSDDPTDLTKYQIPNSVTIPADGYLIFYADNDDEQGPLHTNFGLSANGEDILLVAPDGSTIIDSYSFGLQVPDISEGRCGSTWQFFDAPTPGASNNCNPSFTIYLPLLHKQP